MAENLQDAGVVLHADARLNRESGKLESATRDGEAEPLSSHALELLKELPGAGLRRGYAALESSYSKPILAAPESKNGRFADSRELPPPGYTGPVFKLSQDYPKTMPAEEQVPWAKYDFKTQMPEYMNAVLNYIMEGNVEVGFAGQNNTARKWYHAPWLHYGTSGREYAHGLTMERNSRPGELSHSQSKQYQNWGVGLYNERGAYTLGQVWRDPENPNPDNVRFPEGSVSFKLLFTEAPVSEVPYLKGSPEITANIYKESASPMPPEMPKALKQVRLLQIDVAVKDSRSDTGWVLGTYVYDSKSNADSPWKRVKPVGLAWGSDPDITRMKQYLGEKLKEQVLNNDPDLPPQHLGWGGRLNGPVDNPKSSCMSCHSRAEWPLREVLPPKTAEYDSKEFMSWFANVRGGEAYTPGSKSLDYSLQLAEGLKKYSEWKAEKEKAGKKN